MIRVKRVTSYADRIRAYKVICDEVVIGSIKCGQQIEFNIPAGHHRLYLAIDWCRSNTVDIDTDENVSEFECGSNLRGLRLLLQIVYITFLRNHYLWLKRV